MSGHSKWATIKHKKGAADAKRGKIFSKIIRELSVAARLGGSDPDTNAKLRTVIDKAKNANMPNDNIQRAIKKGAGELEGCNYEEMNLEGYGPGGVAVLVECLSDNRNRTVAELRHIFSKIGGNLGEAGCVAWMFTKKGILTFDKEFVSEETLMNIALEAGAEDITDDEGTLTVTTSPSAYEAVKNACLENNLTALESSLTMIPQTQVKLDGNDAGKMIKLMETIEDHDDVQDVYANFDIDSKVMEELID